MNILSPSSLMEWVPVAGYVGLATIVFVESAFFFCFFLPGDSLLFIAGLLSTQGVFSYSLLLVLLVILAVVGYLLNYMIGRWLGQYLQRLSDRWWYKARYTQQAKCFYQQYGPQAVVIARFVPIVRTFLPLVAGMVAMNMYYYTVATVIGALLWVGGLLSLGYWLGVKFPQIEHYLLPVTLLIIIISVMPIFCRWAIKKRTG